MLTQPFTIAVDDEVLIDLRERIARTRWPNGRGGRVGVRRRPGFSDRPREPGMTKAAIAEVWARLMQGLGYDRFGAHGSDVGGGVTVALGR